ncbi:hypothetical protein [Staphylococcus equorum]|uniref:hypothetical protein n=1 Tax=Staphylococcus equorum TaxID=246432 RepID=UPI0025547DF3|nr:hypothetical protein [Staphylococcus equorum]MDK9853151.1 hypothetical protein [Staphylococcus equorum]
MAYEYECEEVIKNVIKELIYFKKGKNELAEKEIDEIYTKAKAFDEIREIEDEYYNKYGELITVEELVYTVDTILDNYERSERADDER